MILAILLAVITSSKIGVVTDYQPDWPTAVGHQYIASGQYQGGTNAAPSYMPTYTRLRPGNAAAVCSTLDGSRERQILAWEDQAANLPNSIDDWPFASVITNGWYTRWYARAPVSTVVTNSTRLIHGAELGQVAKAWLYRDRETHAQKDWDYFPAWYFGGEQLDGLIYGGSTDWPTDTWSAWQTYGPTNALVDVARWMRVHPTFGWVRYPNMSEYYPTNLLAFVPAWAIPWKQIADRGYFGTDFANDFNALMAEPYGPRQQYVQTQSQWEGMLRACELADVMAVNVGMESATNYIAHAVTTNGYPMRLDWAAWSALNQALTLCQWDYRGESVPSEYSPHTSSYYHNDFGGASNTALYASRPYSMTVTTNGRHYVTFDAQTGNVRNSPFVRTYGDVEIGDVSVATNSYESTDLALVRFSGVTSDAGSSCRIGVTISCSTNFIAGIMNVISYTEEKIIGDVVHFTFSINWGLDAYMMKHVICIYGSEYSVVSRPDVPTGDWCFLVDQSSRIYRPLEVDGVYEANVYSGGIGTLKEASSTFSDVSNNRWRSPIHEPGFSRLFDLNYFKGVKMDVVEALMSAKKNASVPMYFGSLVQTNSPHRAFKLKSYSRSTTIYNHEAQCFNRVHDMVQDAHGRFQETHANHMCYDFAWWMRTHGDELTDAKATFDSWADGVGSSAVNTIAQNRNSDVFLRWNGTSWEVVTSYVDGHGVVKPGTVLNGRGEVNLMDFTDEFSDTTTFKRYEDPYSVDCWSEVLLRREWNWNNLQWSNW